MIEPDSEVDGKIGVVPMILTYGLALFLGWIYVNSYGLGRFLEYENYLGEYGTVLQFGVMAALLVVHEAVHAVSFMVFGGLSWVGIETKIALNPSGTFDPIQFYVYPVEEIGRLAYGLGVAMPGIVLGIVPSLLGIVTGHPLVMAVGIFGVILAPIDVSVLLREVRSDQTQN